MYDSIWFLRTITFRKLTNYLLIRISYFISRVIRKPFHLGMPVSMSIEPTTSCNLRCPECPSGLRQFSRPQGNMDQKNFKDVIDQVKGNLMYLMLYFQGEPFLHPGFHELVKYATANRVYTATSTNGHFLDDHNARKIVESGLSRLIISIDGTDQRTYEKYRKGGELEKVKDGINTLNKWKRELRSKKPFIILQFLVLRTNEHQVPEMRKLAKDLKAGRLELKSAQVYDFENDAEFIPQNPEYSRYYKDRSGQWKLKKLLRNRCFRMWSGAVITWDGRVVPCCFDKDAKYQLGIVRHQTFKEIWRSKDYRKFRSQLLEDRSKIDICRNCTE